MKKNKILPSAAVVFAAALLLLRAAEVRAAVTGALSDAVSKVIPGLFPMLVLADFSGRTGLLCPTGLRAHTFCTRVFGVSGRAFPAVLYGLTAGYPTGIKTARTLYEAGKIDTRQAQRLSSFCLSPGLAFSVLTVGSGFYGSTGTGWLLFVSCTQACLCTGLLSGQIKRNAIPYDPVKHNTEPAVPAFTRSVGKASESIIGVCAWMALCAAGTACAEAVLPENGMLLWRMLCEVTAACSSLRVRRPLPYTAFAMGFGGICVWLQILPELQRTNCRISLFIGSRILCGCLSGLFCRLLCSLFPTAITAVSVPADALHGSKTPIFSFFLIFSCIIFILDLAQREKLWYTFPIGDENETETMGEKYREMLCHLRDRETDRRR